MCHGSMCQPVIPVADASLIYVPKSGQKDLTDKRDGYIISPGYPSQYPDEADGKLRITASTEAVSLPHQLINRSMADQPIIFTCPVYRRKRPGSYSLWSTWM